MTLDRGQHQENKVRGMHHIILLELGLQFKMTSMRIKIMTESLWKEANKVTEVQEAITVVDIKSIQFLAQEKYIN